VSRRLRAHVDCFRLADDSPEAGFGDFRACCAALRSAILSQPRNPVGQAPLQNVWLSETSGANTNSVRKLRLDLASQLPENAYQGP
jgi:hypothetical protein